jgi:hypothetical protein
MNVIEQINRETRQLPREAQIEVLDFARSLRAKSTSSLAMEEDEVGLLLSKPLNIQDARPLKREDIHAR